MSNPPADHVMDDEPDHSPIEDNVKSRSTWIRLVFIVIFAALFNLTAFVLLATVVIGFLYVLFSGETNHHLQHAGRVQAAYLSDLVKYMTFNTDTKPFPFEADLPGSDSDKAE